MIESHPPYCRLFKWYILIQVSHSLWLETDVAQRMTDVGAHCSVVQGRGFAAGGRRGRAREQDVRREGDVNVNGK